MGDLKIFVYDFRGTWLGGKAVILARDEIEARKLIEHRMKDEKGLNYNNKKDKITLKSKHDISEPTIIYFDNGNY